MGFGGSAGGGANHRRGSGNPHSAVISKGAEQLLLHPSEANFISPQTQSYCQEISERIQHNTHKTAGKQVRKCARVLIREYASLILS